MDLSTFVVAVFCLTDDWLKERGPLRQRGPEPKLCDDEVLTIEIVSEFLGMDTDEGIYKHFRRHYAEFFPTLSKVHRTTFARQAANLWAAKEMLWKHLLLYRVRFDPEVSLIDSSPVPVCRFARAYRCRRLAEEAAFGFDEMVKVCWPGAIVGVELAPANAHDLLVAEELLEDAKGWTLGDRNYWSPNLAERLGDEGLCLLAPYKSKKREKKPWPRWLVQKRRRIETVFSQLAERYQTKKVWAKDRWHLTSRLLRKVLSHTVAVYFCQQTGLSPLRFSELLTD